MHRVLFAMLLCLCLCACSGSVPLGQHSSGPDAAALDPWRRAQLAELEALPQPAGVAPELWKLMKGRFAEFILSAPQKSAQAAPVNPSSAPRLSLDDETLTLSWQHSMSGDYSQDSEVGISDLTPLGQHFNSSSELGGSFDFSSIKAVVDGDSNGQINISDISPIGANFGRRCTAYNVYASLSFSDLPDSPGGENGPGAELVDSVDFAGAQGNPGQQRLAFSLSLDEARPGWFYWVRPADGTAEGTPSNAVSFGGGDDNANPEAVLSASPLSGEAPLLVTFDASGSFDFDGEAQDITDIVQFNWDFDGDGSFDIASFGPAISHSYNETGQFSARVQVVDARAGVGEDTVLVTVAQPGNLPPVADFSADPLSGTAPLLVAFDDSATSDDGGVENLLYEWDFNGDGFVDLSTDSTAVVENFYQGGGDFLVELKVTDLGGLSDSHQLALNVEGDPVNTPPVAVLEASVSSGPVPLEVSFDFSESADPDGEIVLYQLDFEGDGDFEVSLETEPVVVEHTYLLGGVFNARLRVEDNIGAFTTASVKIIADDGSNSPPTASFTADPQFGDTPLEVTFNASSSSDLDGSIVLYEWDFEGEGEEDFSFQTTEPIVQHTYTTGGNRTPDLRVTDNEGGVAVLKNLLLINVNNPFNQSPVAALSVSEVSSEFPQEFELDATASSDPDGEIVSYSWDFDGDGFLDRVTQEPQITHRYHAIGTYTPRVTVMDNEDAVDDAGETEIEITSGWQSALVDNLGSFPGATSLIVIKIKDATNYFLGYVKDNDELRLATAALAAPLSWSVIEAQPAAGESPGSFISLMSVEQTAGLFYIDAPNTTDERLRYTRAADFEVTSWSAPVTVRGAGELSASSVMSARSFAGRPAVLVNEGNSGLRFYRADDSLGAAWDGVGLSIDAGIPFGDALGIGQISAAAQKNGELIFYRASLSDGSSWGAGVTVLDNGSDNTNLNRLGLGLSAGLPAIGYVQADSSLGFVRAQDTAGLLWSEPVTVFDASETPEIIRGDITIGSRNSMPALVCTHGRSIMFVQALDVNGSSWGEPELAAIEGDFPRDPAAVILSSGVLITYVTRVNGSNKLMVAFRE